jgi:hypothetical protein
MHPKIAKKQIINKALQRKFEIFTSNLRLYYQGVHIHHQKKARNLRPLHHHYPGSFRLHHYI